MSDGRVTLLLVWDFARGMLLEHAPRKFWRAVLGGCAALALLGVAGPQEWVTGQLVDALFAKAADVQRQLQPMLVELLTPDVPAPTPTATP